MTRRISVFGVIAASIVSMVLGSAACSDGSEDRSPVGSGAPSRCGDVSPEALVPEVVGERPHDPEAFTQGLLVVGDVLYESTGLEGESSVRAVDPETGEVLQRADLGPESFAEGLTTLDEDRLVQLTWKDGRALVRNRSDLAVVDEHRYEGEGWGITTLDDGRLVMSDGSDVLAVRDPEDFSVVDRWTIERRGGEVDRLNELEWDGERIWANRWQTDEIVRIDPDCRVVDGVVDASRLVERAAELAASPIDVLNGIAHLPGTDRFLVTGKNWPVMFEVRFVPGGG